MARDQHARVIKDFVAERARRPFGAVELNSGRIMQRYSFAGKEAAENLLHKALHALDDGNADRATAFVERAARLPFDEHEQAAPAAIAASMLLFNAVTDELENCDEDDAGWLDAAVAALAALDGDTCAISRLRHVLAVIASDYQISRRERQRIEAAIASIPERADLREMTLTEAQLCEEALSVLAACRAYESAISDTTSE